MALLSWPSAIRPTRTTGFYIVGHTRTYTSPVYRTEVLQRGGGPRWHVTLTFGLLTKDRYKDLEGLIANLMGGDNTVDLPDHRWSGNRGDAGGSVTATGNAGSRSVTLNNMTGTLWRGDRFTAGGRLYLVRSQVSTGGASTSVLIEPPLRANLSNATVAFSATQDSASCAMRILDDNQWQASFGAIDIADFGTVSFIEPRP